MRPRSRRRPIPPAVRVHGSRSCGESSATGPRSPWPRGAFRPHPRAWVSARCRSPQSAPACRVSSTSPFRRGPAAAGVVPRGPPRTGGGQGLRRSLRGRCRSAAAGGQPAVTVVGLAKARDLRGRARSAPRGAARASAVRCVASDRHVACPRGLARQPGYPCRANEPEPCRTRAGECSRPVSSAGNFPPGPREWLHLVVLLSRRELVVRLRAHGLYYMLISLSLYIYIYISLHYYVYIYIYIYMYTHM